ncbi:Gas vesicle synthesis protein GvpL/GvpF [Thalassobacillus cyri]|uniref:Gas vesicle synthesis protein GvpL/GvpF n=1 Tax=Thalassobacillus cyri TaxID=571932 RepID=A0A1H4GDJ7_9BACI|nr:GvpL/GvpF family gas vesicle protein [Thalassobacillus cyri]SEB07351.1 Gas vesicle synthesis protein GvpL/GvpF [Thalassobacillus cyri]
MAELIYLYGIIPTNEKSTTPLPSFKGLDDEHDVHTLSFDGIDAVVCNLEESEYNQSALEEKTSDVEWLHEKAFHHHEAVTKLHEKYTIIPMKFSTIYSGYESLESTIKEHHKKMSDLLAWLSDKEEWNLKIYCDNEALRERTSAHNLTIEEKKKEIDQMSPGRQYLEKRKLDHLIDQELEKDKETYSSRIHDQLASYSEKTDIKKNWSKDVTGRSDEMCWNSVYLLKEANVEDFLSQVKHLQEVWKETGFQFELTGPWPAYHFAKLT